MDVESYMRKHGLTDADVERMAQPYEDGDYPASVSGTVFSGSHLDVVGKRSVTVLYDAADAQRVDALARARGVKRSQIYRDALDYYLAAQA